MYKKLSLLLWLCLSTLSVSQLSAQTVRRAISGIVIGSMNQPISGATVYIEGASHSITTDAKGSFRLEAPTSSCILIVKAPYMLPSTRDLGAGSKSLALTIKMMDKVAGLPELDVVAHRQRAPFASVAYSGLRFGVPVLQLPMSIDIIDRDKLEELQALSMTEAVRYASGISTASAGEANNVSEVFVSRGFSMSNSRNYFKDGMRYRKVTNTALSSVERLEFFRGPASGAYGSVEPGGIVNIITRPALYSPRYSATLRVGSYGLKQVSTDLTGSITSDKRVRYRLGGLYETSDSYRNHVNWQKFSLSPRIDLDLGERTTLTLNADYFSDDRVVDPGVPHIKGKVVPGGERLFVGEPWARAKFTTLDAGYMLRHSFSKAWRLNSQFRYTTLSEDRLYFQMKEIKSDKMNRRLAHWDASIQYYTWQNDLVGEFATGYLDHKVLLGIEYEKSYNRREVYGDTFAPIDLKNPQYVQKPSDLSKLKKSTDLEVKQDNIAFYAQDFVSLSDRLHLLVGARADWSSDDNNNKVKKDGHTQTNTFAISPRLAITHNPIESLGVYASYSSSFVPTSGQTKEGKAFEPIRSYQWEVGAKQMLLGNKLMLSLAAYHLAKTNVLTPDLEDPKYKIQIGEQYSKGIELGIHGKLLPGLSLDVNYAYTLGEVSRTNDKKIPVGSKLANTPKHMINLWTSYSLEQGWARGLSFGAGALYAGKRFGNSDNSISLPAYFTLDSFVSYTGPFYKVSLNAKNLLDERYYLGAQASNLLTQVPARTFVLSTSFFL